MKTIILSVAFISVFLLSRKDGSEIDSAGVAKTYGKTCKPFDFETKKNDPNYRDIFRPRDDFKTLYLKQNNPNGDGC